MKQFIKIDYYIQVFLACVLNPLGVITVYGIALVFPIIGLYQLISDLLHLFAFKTEFLKKERTIHFYGAIIYLILVGLGTYLFRNFDDSIRFTLFIIFYILIPEIMVWVRFSWARKHFKYEKNHTNNELNLIEELQDNKN